MRLASLGLGHPDNIETDASNPAAAGERFSAGLRSGGKGERR
jgi:hypothetical protein